MEFKQKVVKAKNKIMLGAGALVTAISLPVAAHASDSSGLSINFDVSNMFTWAQTIIDALTPVIYVTLGISLGFLVIRSLRNAF